MFRGSDISWSLVCAHFQRNLPFSKQRTNESMTTKTTTTTITTTKKERESKRARERENERVPVCVMRIFADFRNQPLTREDGLKVMSQLSLFSLKAFLKPLDKWRVQSCLPDRYSPSEMVCSQKKITGWNLGNKLPTK